jgi:hypothetical protein
MMNEGNNGEILSNKHLPAEEFGNILFYFLISNLDGKIFKKLLHMGLKCCIEDRKLRPSFSEIIAVLVEN